MIIKVCGMRDEDNIRAMEQLDIDWMGFIFYPKSNRFVSEVPSYLPKRIKKIGVFVNDTPENILKKVREFELDMVQLHGGESPLFCSDVQNIGISVIKTFSIGDDEFPSALVNEFEGRCDYFLFDTKTNSYGGSGVKFKWDVLKDYKGNTPFLLSGGISLEDVEAIKRFSHPHFIGIDINSCFESSPALKDINRVKLFTDQLTR